MVFLNQPSICSSGKRGYWENWPRCEEKGWTPSSYCHCMCICKLSCWYCRRILMHVLSVVDIHTHSILYHYQILKDKAQSRLKSAADQHWSDGALEVTLCSLYCLILALFDACYSGLRKLMKMFKFIGVFVSCLFWTVKCEVKDYLWYNINGSERSNLWIWAKSEDGDYKDTSIQLIDRIGL